MPDRDMQGLNNSGKGLIGTATLLAFFLLSAAGCGGSSNPNENPEAAHIKKVAALIPEYTTAHEGNPPADIEQLKSWAVQNGKAEDKDFLSTRDKEPYVIAVTGGGKPKKGSNPIVHEAKGKNGMLFMVNSGTGTPSEISQQGLGYMTGNMGNMGVPKGSKGQPVPGEAKNK